MSLLVRAGRLPGVSIIAGQQFGDDRGYMARLLDQELFTERGLPGDWSQESRSHTVRRNTVRGIHVSLPPALECKTITAFRGTVFWVVVDLRADSPTFGEWEGTTISGEASETLCVDRGFGHGMLSLTDHCDLLLRASVRFESVRSAGIRWDAPELSIQWPLAPDDVILSDRDAAYPDLTEFLRNHGRLET